MNDLSDIPTDDIFDEFSRRVNYGEIRLDEILLLYDDKIVVDSLKEYSDTVDILHHDVIINDAIHQLKIGKFEEALLVIQRGFPRLEHRLVDQYHREKEKST